MSVFQLIETRFLKALVPFMSKDKLDRPNLCGVLMAKSVGAPPLAGGGKRPDGSDSTTLVASNGKGLLAIEVDSPWLFPCDEVVIPADIVTKYAKKRGKFIVHCDKTLWHIGESSGDDVNFEVFNPVPGPYVAWRTVTEKAITAITCTKQQPVFWHSQTVAAIETAEKYLGEYVCWIHGSQPALFVFGTRAVAVIVPKKLLKPEGFKPRIPFVREYS